MKSKATTRGLCNVPCRPNLGRTHRAEWRKRSAQQTPGKFVKSGEGELSEARLGQRRKRDTSTPYVVDRGTVEAGIAAGEADEASSQELWGKAGQLITKDASNLVHDE